MNRNDYREIAEWMQTQTESIKYGEIVLKITLHDGIRYIERSISEKTKIEKELN